MHPVPARKTPRPVPSARLDRDAWIDAARKSLIREGIERVKVERLADDLKVTRGSFYWHFKNREDLLSALLQSWRARNIDPFLKVLDHDGDQPGVQFRKYVNLWFSPKIYDPDYDSAVRDWARSAPKVKRLVRESDAARMAVLEKIYLAMGFAPTEAEVRARITYYHQVGYYAMRIKESAAVRAALLPTYVAILAGPVGTAAYEDETK